MMALGAGVVIPNVLRWYWWQLNGWGYSIGTLGGMFLSLVALFFPEIPNYYLFPFICSFSLAMSVIVSLKTEQVSKDRLINFYITVRPFGIWKPIREQSGLLTAKLSEKGESGWIALLNVFLGLCMITGLYLSPVFLVGHWYGKSILWLIVLLISIIILKFTWYDNLPKAEKVSTNSKPGREEI